MNARTHLFELTLEQRQLEEAVQCVFHNLLLLRSVGKFNYRGEGNYSIGVVGTEDVDCETIDLTYLRVSSRELAHALRLDVLSLCSAVRAQACPDVRANVSLEFYQKRRRQWPIKEDSVPWEIWQLQLMVVQAQSEADHSLLRGRVGEDLSDLIFTLCSAVNRPQFLPKMPVQSDLPLVFDTRFSDIQPYLWKMKSCVRSARDGGDGLEGAPGAGQGISTAMRRLIKDTLSL